MTEDELSLLGLLIGDGCTLPRHSLEVITGDEDLAELSVKLSNSLFPEMLRTRIDHQINNGHPIIHVYLSVKGGAREGHRNPIAFWLDSLGAWGLRSYEKRVPKKVFEQSDRQVAVFLRHLWTTDGCVGV